MSGNPKICPTPGGGGPVVEYRRSRVGIYLTGRLGGVKVLVMENLGSPPEPTMTPAHNLFFVEAADCRQGAGAAEERFDGQRVLGCPGCRSTHQVSAP